MRTTTLATLVLGVIGLSAHTTFAQSFTGLGDLAGGSFFSSANGLSGDGQLVTGGSQIAGNEQEAYLWTTSTGMVGLGFPAGSVSSRGSAVSNDGGTVAGSHIDGAFLSRAFLWTTGGGPVDFDPFPAGADSRSAHDVSADGGTFVGSYRPSVGGLDVAYHWSGGSLTEIEDPSLDDSTSAAAVSADGSVVVGGTTILDFPNPLIREAFLWTAGDGITRLGFLPGASNNSSAAGISADGNVVVGISENVSGDDEAFRWTEADGMIGLGDLPGGDFDSAATDTTADGSTVVGRSNVLGGFSSSSYDPFIWDETHGMRNLVDVLTNDYGLGAQLAGWNLTEATAISDDAHVIVGNGINPDGNFEAWRAVLVPEPNAGLLGVVAVLCSLFVRRRRS